MYTYDIMCIAYYDSEKETIMNLFKKFMFKLTGRVLSIDFNKVIVTDTERQRTVLFDRDLFINNHEELLSEFSKFKSLLGSIFWIAREKYKNSIEIKTLQDLENIKAEITATLISNNL